MRPKSTFSTSRTNLVPSANSLTSKIPLNYLTQHTWRQDPWWPCRAVDLSCICHCSVYSDRRIWFYSWYSHGEPARQRPHVTRTTGKEHADGLGSMAESDTIRSEVCRTGGGGDRGSGLTDSPFIFLSIFYALFLMSSSLCLLFWACWERVVIIINLAWIFFNHIFNQSKKKKSFKEFHKNCKRLS